MIRRLFSLVVLSLGMFSITYANGDVFIRVAADKTSVYEQEPVLLTYTVYTAHDLTRLEGDMPELQDCYSVSIESDERMKPKEETINGRTYKYVTWRQYLLYPQKDGKLTIPSSTYQGTVVRYNASSDPIDDFFNGGGDFIEEDCIVAAPEYSITVKPLPTHPIGFSSGVGLFSISASLTQDTIRAGEPFQIIVSVSGRGNLKIIKAPVISLPKDFVCLEPSIDDSTKCDASGYSGSMIYTYTITPTNQGTYKIPSIKFTFFDPSEQEYKTVTTEDIAINVIRGSGKIYTDEQLHPLKEGAVKTQSADGFFFGSMRHIILIAALLLGYILCVILMKRRFSYLSNRDRVRYDRAKGEATKRLYKAQELMEDGNRAGFYAEISQSLWKYAADKLGIDTVDLSKNNVKERLLSYRVDENLVEKFIYLIDVCETNLYSSETNSTQDMSENYERAKSVIENIDDVLNQKSTKSRKRSLVLSLAICLFACLNAQAITKEMADSAYHEGNYQMAIDCYQHIINEKVVSAGLFYNLGNAFYCTNDFVKAKEAYSVAHQLAPLDGDIRDNLHLACSKGKIAEPETESMLTLVGKGIIFLFSVDTWTLIGIVTLVLSMSFAAMYLFADSIVRRKTGFYTALLLIAIFILCSVAAYMQMKEIASIVNSVA